MTEKTLNNNQVVVAGEIASEFVFSHEIFGEGFYMVDLIVSRLSDAYDTIPLMVSDRLFDVNESHIGERIMAKGLDSSFGADASIPAGNGSEFEVSSGDDLPF